MIRRLSFAALLLGCPVLMGCPQAVSAIVPGVQFAVCVLNVYSAEPAGVPIGQVVADSITKCGGDAASVINVLDAHEAAAIHATVAHGKPQ